MKTLTREQIKLLQPYEQHFRTAINSDWSRYPGVEALKIMHEALELKTRLNANCQSCVLRLLQDCGRLYFESKQAVEVADVPAETKKTSVRTSRKNSKK